MCDMLRGDDRHLVKVRENDLETLLRYNKLHCDEKLEKSIAREFSGVRGSKTSIYVLLCPYLYSVILAYP